MSDAITMTGNESVAAASRVIGEEHGLELYRTIYSRFKIVGPENGQRILDEILNPRPCRSAIELRDRDDPEGEGPQAVRREVPAE